MWRLGFFFHEIAFGLLSVFIPLYVVTFQDTSVLGGPLVALGVMTSLAVFFTIPASFIWGYLCDATRHYKGFILLSFLSSAIILFLFTLPFAQNILIFVILYVIMQVLHVAHESPKNVLVAENYSRDEWEKSYALYEGFTEIGYSVGLATGLITFAFALSFSSIVPFILYLCSGLSLAAFILSVFLVADPMMIFERRLVRIEKKIDFTCQGIDSTNRLLDGYSFDKGPKQEKFSGFALSIFLFSLATSIVFTPLPLFFQTELLMSTSMIYVTYILCSIGATFGYFIVGRRASTMNIRKQMPRFILFRSLLIFLLVAVAQFAISPTLMSGIILALLGFAYGVYYILMLSLSMELIPDGKAGLFDVLVGCGTAVGAFLGPYLAETIAFYPTFMIAAVIFFLAFIAIKIFT